MYLLIHNLRFEIGLHFDVLKFHTEFVDDMASLISSPVGISVIYEFECLIAKAVRFVLFTLYITDKKQNMENCPETAYDPKVEHILRDKLTPVRNQLSQCGSQPFIQS